MPRQLSLSLCEFSFWWTKFGSILDCVYLPGIVSLPIIFRKFSFSIPSKQPTMLQQQAALTLTFGGFSSRLVKKYVDLLSVLNKKNSNMCQQYLIQLQPSFGKLEKLELVLQASSVITQACNACYPVLAGSNVYQ